LSVAFVDAWNWRITKENRMLGWLNSAPTAEDDMARRAQKPDPDQSAVLVAKYVVELKAAQRDRALFASVVARLEQEKLSPPDFVRIAVEYRGGGTKPTSKKAAMDSIAKRFLELVRDHTKEVQAAKARPW
jgi:hypothetical protein